MKYLMAARRMNLVCILTVVLLVIAGCASMSKFDQHVYVQTISAKVDAMNVMDLATDSFARHQQELKDVTTELDKVYEYERNRRNNGTTLALWDTLRNPAGALWGSFVRRWKEEAVLRPAYIREKKRQVGEAFDIIAQLESRKLKPKDVK